MYDFIKPEIKEGAALRLPHLRRKLGDGIGRVGPTAQKRSDLRQPRGRLLRGTKSAVDQKRDCVERRLNTDRLRSKLMKHQNIVFDNPLFLADNNPFPRTDFESKEIIEDEKGNKQYPIKNMTKGEFGLEEIEIVVASPANPVEGMEVMAPVSYKNIVLNVGKMRNGRKF